MQEFSAPPFPPMASDEHLLRPILDWALREPSRVMAAYRDGDHFVDVTAAQVYDRVTRLAKGFVASGVKPGDRVALMSATRIEWMLTDYAIMAAGGVTVPIYETSSAEQIQWVVRDSGARVLIVETPAMRDLYRESEPDPDFCRYLFVIDEGGLDSLAVRGSTIPDWVVEDRIRSLRTDDLASIVYTSGTTGRPKGCMLTHGNLRTNVWQNLDAIRPMLQPDEVGLQFLPMAHTLAKIITLVGVEWGVRGAFCSGIDRLAEELAMVRPTMVAAVPRIFEKVYNGARQKAESEGHARIFDQATEVAIKWSERHMHGGLHLVTDAEHQMFEPLVYRKVRDAFGGRLRFAFSGGGPLGERLTHFFHGTGVKIFEGYGLTETSPTLTVNRAAEWRPGTVGQPVAGTVIRIAEDGEILAQGPQVFGGYWHNPQATSETFDEEGWYRTGDIGALDDDGFLRITGRKKELIVTAGGKNVAPAPLEDRLRAHPLISQAVVVGDNRPFIAALITIDEEARAEWVAAGGPERTSLHALVQEAINAANQSVSRAESIRKFTILPRDLTVADGELTPTLKVRRVVVEKTFAPELDELYGGPAPV